MTRDEFDQILSAAGFTKAELARRAGVNRATVTRWGLGHMRAETAVKIEEATGGKVRRSALRPDLWPDAQGEAA